jgi:hypothetical protein
MQNQLISHLTCLLFSNFYFCMNLSTKRNAKRACRSIEGLKQLASWTFSPRFQQKLGFFVHSRKYFSPFRITQWSPLTQESHTTRRISLGILSNMAPLVEMSNPWSHNKSLEFWLRIHQEEEVTWDSVETQTGCTTLIV